MSMSPKGSRNGAEFLQKHDTMASTTRANYLQPLSSCSQRVYLKAGIALP